jgi:hypothetical protein
MALRLALAPILVVLTLVSAAPLAGANESGEVRPHGFAHGRLELAASRQGAILSGRDLVPGDRVSGSLTIANAGTLAGSFTLSGAVRGSARLAEHLVLTVRERTHGVHSLVYSGSLAGLRAVKLGVIGPAQARTFRFAVSFRATGSHALDDGFQGLRTTATFTWTAVQAS